MLQLLRPLLAALCLIAAAAARPTLFIIGDSTVRNQTAGQCGWGDPLAAHFDPAKIEVINRAIGGRSSRSFFTEGRWEAVMANLQPGDFVLIQFGHNDGGAPDDERGRASLKGAGEDTREIRRADGQPETVHSYGWYLRQYLAGARAKGATAIVLSPIPRNLWQDGRIGRAAENYGSWAKQAAAREGAPFIDFNSLLADRYEALGPEMTAALFAGTDHTHTGPAGAAFNAAVLATALRDTPLQDTLLPADLWLPRIFGDHMVLQRETPAPLWGTTAANAPVSARIAGKSVAGTADREGHFRLELPALPAGGPYVLEVSAGDVQRRFEDVLVGEVWLCSGQSNMDFTVAQTPKRPFAGTRDWQQEVAAARHPQLRMFCAEWTLRESPQPETAGAWQVCSPATVGDFSAVAYFFGRALQQDLHLPVGLVTCARGSSTAEAWLSPEKLAAVAAFKPLLQSYDRKCLSYRDQPQTFAAYGRQMTAWREAGARDKVPAHPDPVQDPHSPAVLFNGMIAPVIPYGIRGIIWYQGESNLATRSLYPALQRALIEDWRGRWGRGELPFYFVQLPAYKAPQPEPGDSSLATLREAQASSLALPATGMAVTLDIGEEKDIHPRNKQEVGRRLALQALSGVYGRSIVAGGPVFQRAEAEGDRLRLHFDRAAGLMANGGAPLQQFAIAGADRKFVRAEALIEDGTVLVSSPAVPHPAYVRYAWADNPAGANLCNGAGLPAAPFRSDP